MKTILVLFVMTSTVWATSFNCHDFVLTAMLTDALRFGECPENLLAKTNALIDKCDDANFDSLRKKGCRQNLYSPSACKLPLANYKNDTTMIVVLTNGNYTADEIKKTNHFINYAEEEIDPNQCTKELSIFISTKAKDIISDKVSTVAQQLKEQKTRLSLEKECSRVLATIHDNVRLLLADKLKYCSLKQNIFIPKLKQELCSLSPWSCHISLKKNSSAQ